MKKSNLFKAIGIVILFYVAFTWIVPIIYSIAGLEGEVSNQIGLVSFISVILETFSGFGTTILYILLVGGFYGVLKATGAYEALMDKLSSKTNGKEKCTLITIIVVLAVLASIAGLDLAFLIVYPILIGLIVKMGYDKLVAVASTVGATLVGMYGATLAGTLYGANNQMLQLKTYDNILVKVILFVLGLAALIAMVIIYNNKNNLPKTEKPVKKADKKETKKDAKKSAPKKTLKTGVSAMPALIVCGLLFLVVVVGTINFGGIFGTDAEGMTWLVKAHNAWTEWTIGNFPVLGKLFGGVEALGTWINPNRFQTYSLLLVIAMLIIKFCYRTKTEDAFEGFVDGIKSFIIPAMLAILAYSVFVFVYYNPTISVVTGNLLTKKFNVLLSGLYVLINSVFYVDYYYLAYSLLYGTVYTDAQSLSILSVMFTSLYSLVMLIAPTSVLLMVTLSISDVKYTDWIKFIWKLVLVLFVIALIVLSIMKMV